MAGWTWENLWAGTLEDLIWDVPEGTITMKVSAIWGPTKCHWTVLLEDVSRLHFDNSIEYPWTYAEVTSAVDRTAQGGATEVEIEFWSTSTSLSMTAGSVSITEANDDNPGRPPSQ